MVIFKTASQLALHLEKLRNSGNKTGFVPTMGALHNGHLSLLKNSLDSNDITICSIFINPTQFSNEEDFKNYPVTIESDIEQLVNSGCNILFLPPASEIYPAGYIKKHYDLGYLENILEGSYRPGHFQGVCQVVDRLLEIVSPDTIYIGQKDFQQCLVIKKLLDITGKKNKITVIINPTLREDDGLAMSSRNMRLYSEERKKASFIFQQLQWVKDNFGEIENAVLENSAKKRLEEAGFVVDYINIADAATLLPSTPATGQAVVLAAASIGKVRLIDNLIIN